MRVDPLVVGHSGILTTVVVDRALVLVEVRRDQVGGAPRHVPSPVHHSLQFHHCLL